MTRRLLGSLTLALGVVLLLAQPMGGSWHVPRSSPAPAGTVVSPAQHAALAADYGKLPLAFEVNAGQAGDRAVRFVARGSGYTLALTPGAAFLALSPSVAATRQPGGFALPGQPPLAAAAARQPATLLGMAWLGANPQPIITGEEPLPGTINYFLGNDPTKWHTHIPTYQQVRLHNVYPGVDLVYYGSGGQLEYDFVVAPGADPSRIALGFSGANRLGVDLLGNLSLSLPGGSIAQQKPLIYQSVNGARQPVVGGYTLASGGRISFAWVATIPICPW